ncbi:bromodomain-containing protein [Naegleria gruberi]|uniref:Bromodomain-containing protein n=1 Tax=Naegleria gruberi TaxID=5762 RepID=D2V227_NAEGR|nr:bromodomain-containing protein [Naegleria gruberi]EFC48831.1 bromodomain-containing protein [Naegleria gruberi]|eukprot:XP_002681575.1 bromodomain-containing protein [Naegleria gruberi strain NEG-M]
MISSSSEQLDLLNSKNFVSPAELAYLDCYLEDRTKNSDVDYSRVYQEAKKHITCMKKATFNKSKIKSLLGEGDLESQEKSYNSVVEKRLKFLELVNDKLSNSIQFMENNQDKDLNVKIIMEQFTTTFEFAANIIPVPTVEPGEEKPQKKRKSKQLEIDTSVATTSSSTTNHTAETPTETPTSVSETPTEAKVESTPKKRKFNKRTEASTATKVLNDRLSSILEELNNHEHADIFRDEVPKDTPHYYESILQPVCLTQLKKKLEKKEITTELELKHQLLLMYQNCIMYNDDDTEYYQAAKEMKQFTIDLFSTGANTSQSNTKKVQTKKKKK